ncbi:hypothetical protein LSH36_294g03060 [Paralvinella palmiformis]|uniref:Uncharacterized protein n=1 Tax=Paralvinella palmiformis TaxID=53620 RepID=A0AAD9JHZ2_9ANNE|nr:hypothetical protein LSH36_294g03060 [Paralvinella palmiformis]
MPTIDERENLLSEVLPKHTGFTPRPIQKLAVKKKPHTMLDVECNHFLQSSRDEATHGIPPLSYRMWLEASKYDPPIPEKPDPQYNSNVWRNFRKQFGFHVNSEGQKVSEMIAAMYPLNIPSPSRVGDYTYEKFLTEISLIKDEKLRRMAIRRTGKDVEEFKKLKLRAEVRNPPVDPEGSILPPANFKRYAPRFIPPDTPSMWPPPAPPGQTQVDIFGRNVPKARPEPYMWKLSYKLNHPDFKKLKDEVNQRITMSRQRRQPATLTFGKVR